MDELTYLDHNFPGKLRCGSMHPEHFRLLMTISGVQSTRVQMALEDYLVNGLSRKDSCKIHGISTGYMSVSLQKLQALSSSVADLSAWYVTSQAPVNAAGH